MREGGSSRCPEGLEPVRGRRGPRGFPAVGLREALGAWQPHLEAPSPSCSCSVLGSQACRGTAPGQARGSLQRLLGRPPTPRHLPPREAHLRLDRGGCQCCLPSPEFGQLACGEGHRGSQQGRALSKVKHKEAGAGLQLSWHWPPPPHLLGKVVFRPPCLEKAVSRIGSCIFFFFSEKYY